ncbi:MAG: glycosyltransferase family 87 protein [Pseudomonadota bacterium]
MPPPANGHATPDRFRQIALWLLLAAFVWRSLDFVDVLKVQPLGVDYTPFRAGMQALADGRAYDFTYVTQLQGWPMGPSYLRPFLYPPSSFFLFAPLAALPYWPGYGLLVVASYALFALAGRRVGAPWWMMLFPAAGLVALCGQLTFLLGALIVTALSLPRRPAVAGVLLGLAATLKPQLLVLAPIALIGARQWRTLVAAGATTALVAGLSTLIWGVEPWLQWVAAMPRFQNEVVPGSPGQFEDGITPYSMLAAQGLPGLWALCLAPAALTLAWVSLRRPDPLDRLVLLMGATLMILSYAMHYEAALLLPAVAAYLARTRDRLWPLYAAAACFFTVGLVFGFAPVAAALVLPLSTWLRDNPGLVAYARRATAKSARS